ncbi:MAG: ribose ABC transporter permease [Rhodothalassiaceae bacterium]|nr:MAG: ribose ABC transporter permease [Rhodothalassiaceae bacterium]
MNAGDLQVVFRGLDHSDALEAAVRKEAEKLFRLHDRFTSGTVTIEALHRQNRWGVRYAVTISLHSPALGDVVVSHESGEGSAKPDPYLAVREAFEAALRQVRDRREKLIHKSRAAG